MICVPRHQLTYSVPNKCLLKEEMNESGKAKLFILIHIINTYNWELGSKHMSVFPLGDKTTASL